MNPLRRRVLTEFAYSKGRECCWFTRSIRLLKSYTQYEYSETVTRYSSALSLASQRDQEQQGSRNPNERLEVQWKETKYVRIFRETRFYSQCVFMVKYYDNTNLFVYYTRVRCSCENRPEQFPLPV